MNERYRDYSSGSDEDSTLTGSRKANRSKTLSPAYGAIDKQEETDEIMLSEFLASLHSSAGYADGMHTGSYPAAARARSAAGKNPSKRTVVHRRKRRDDLAGPCNHCGALTSPQWRKGPKGKPVLCNACGIRFLRNRTLTKVMPKKRRPGNAGGAGKRNKAAALAAAAALEADEDGMLGLDEDMTAADEELDEDYSAAAAAAAAVAAQHYQLQPHLQQQLLRYSRLAAADAALFCDEPDTNHSDTQEQEVHAKHGPASADAAGAHAVQDMQQQNDRHPAMDVLGPYSKPSAGSPLPAVGRELLFGNSGRSLLAQLGECPSLTVALAMHQQQQQRWFEEEQRAEELQQQQRSKYNLPKVPELQLFPPSSPLEDSTGTGFPRSPERAAVALAAAAAAAPSSSSPVSSTNSLLQLQQQHSSGSPPLSPLFLGQAGAPAAGLRGAGSVLGLQLAGTATTSTSSGSTIAAAAPQPQSADILQLVQQLGLALGGVGPAVEFLKLCSGNPAAVAAAVAAVAASSGTCA